LHGTSSFSNVFITARQSNQIHTYTPYFSKIPFNITDPTKPTFPEFHTQLTYYSALPAPPTSPYMTSSRLQFYVKSMNIDATH